jgi:hypothetical protein
MFDTIFSLLPQFVMLLLYLLLGLCLAWLSAWNSKRQIRNALLILGLTEIQIRWQWWQWQPGRNTTFWVSYRDLGGILHQTECLSSMTAFGAGDLYWQESPQTGGPYHPNPLLQRRKRG